jgi:hypothetical protein
MIHDTHGYRLINLRRDNASSQLVIITHDENFLRQLAAEDACDFFWSVRIHVSFPSERTDQSSLDNTGESLETRT